MLAATVVVAALLASAAVAIAAPSHVPGSASPPEFDSATAAGGAPSGRASGKAASNGWSWSASARTWARTKKVLPAALVRRGATAPITRAQFLDALLKVETLRTPSWNQQAPRRLLESDQAAPALADAPAGSARARAVAYGWFIAKPGRRFDANTPITSDEAALAVLGALGLRPDVKALAARFAREVPEAKFNRNYGAAQAMVRTLGMRYNVLEGWERNELGPKEAVNVAHGAYMLRAAVTNSSSWQLDEAKRLAASFDLPTLTPNQSKVLSVALKQLGQPYIWAGETEGSQAEGHAGFDCSGFTIRVINQAGVATGDIDTINERTTYTQSDIPRSKRITEGKLRPGDAMFFGDRGPRSTPTQNFHAGVYMGNGWFIHSSGGNGGVAINSLDGWWGDSFAWGRRALKR